MMPKRFIRVNQTRLKAGLPAISVIARGRKARYYREIKLRPGARIIQKGASVWVEEPQE